MKSTLLAASILLFATACGSNQPAPQVASSQDAMATSTAPAPGLDCPSPFYSPLPDAAIRFPFPFHLHEDRIYRATDGVSRQRVVLEYFKGDAASVWQEVDKAMKAAGYRRSGADPADFRGSFRKTGMPIIFVDTSGSRPQSVANPKARGTIWLSWSLDGEQAAIATTN